jgi:hypothetical protein
MHLNRLTKQTVYKPDLMDRKQTKDQAERASRGADLVVEKLEVICRVRNWYGDEQASSY